MSNYNWKIWYETVTVTGSTQLEWEQAPYDGILAVYEIIGYKNNKIELGIINSGVDWYWLNKDDGHISNNGSSHPEEGKWMPLVAPSNIIIKRGKIVSDHVMREIEADILKEICNV